MNTTERKFVHVDGFTDDTAYVVLTISGWNYCVGRNGDTWPCSTSSENILSYVAEGDWREIIDTEN